MDSKELHIENDSYSDEFDEEESLVLPQFNVTLLPVGSVGSAFRTENDQHKPFQRTNLVERKGVLDLRCSCLDVIHGQFSPDTDGFATLIVLKFRFHSRKQERRFERVEVSLEFKEMDRGGKCPVVYDIKPLERLSVAPTEQREELKRSANVQLGAAAPVGGVTATGSVGLEKSVGRDTVDYTTISGFIDLKGRNWGEPNCATWTLLENSSAKKGVPESMQVAVLLKRKTMEAFQCIVKIDAVADFRSKMERVFGGKGRNPKDDPVFFDPNIKPTNRLRQYDANNLGACDLEHLMDVTHATVLSGTMKETNLRHQT